MAKVFVIAVGDGRFWGNNKYFKSRNEARKYIRDIKKNNDKDTLSDVGFTRPRVANAGTYDNGQLKQSRI